MLSTEVFKSFEISCNNANRLHHKIAADLSQYNQLLQETSDLLEQQLETSRAERETLSQMLEIGKEKLSSRKKELDTISDNKK